MRKLAIAVFVLSALTSVSAVQAAENRASARTHGNEGRRMGNLRFRRGAGVERGGGAGGSEVRRAMVLAPGLGRQGRSGDEGGTGASGES